MTHMLRHLATIDLDDGVDPSRRSPATGLAPFVDRLLETLDSSAARATFFVPQGVAQKSSGILRRISSGGHEVACLTTDAPGTRPPHCTEFRNHAISSRAAIEDATGVRVRGHRAYGLAVDSSTEWVYDILVDEGFEYDSSRLPPRLSEYGQAAVPSSVHAVQRWAGSLVEVPVTTTDLFAMRFQVGTTGSIRGMPLLVTKRFVHGRERRGDPAVIHVRHAAMSGWGPVALDTRSRGDSGGASEARTLRRLGQLLASFPFTSVEQALPDLRRSAPIIQS